MNSKQYTAPEMEVEPMLIETRFLQATNTEPWKPEGEIPDD